MKVFRLHHLWLIWNNMCDDDNFQSKKLLISFGIIFFEQTMLLHLFVTSLMYALDQLKVGDIENALYGIFQLTAGCFGFAITLALHYNRKMTRTVFEKIQNIADSNCVYMKI